MSDDEEGDEGGQGDAEDQMMTMMDMEEANDEEKLIMRQALLEAGLQESVRFEVNFVSDSKNIAPSIALYISNEKTIEEKLKLTREIDAYNDQARSAIGNQFGYRDYFNFGLNTTTWRMIVNKQILMRYERLFIEKQMNEVNAEKRNLEKTLKDLEMAIANVKGEQKRILEGGSDY